MSDPIAEAIRHPDVKRLYRYWCEKRAGREFPARADIDPLDFVYALGNIALVDVFDNPRRFRFRLVGVNLVRRAGYDLTGKYSDEIPNTEFRGLVQRAHDDAIDRRAPGHYIRDQLADGHVLHYEVLILPLAADGRRIDKLLVFSKGLEQSAP